MQLFIFQVLMSILQHLVPMKMKQTNRLLLLHPIMIMIGLEKEMIIMIMIMNIDIIIGMHQRPHLCQQKSIYQYQH